MGKWPTGNKGILELPFNCQSVVIYSCIRQLFTEHLLCLVNASTLVSLGPWSPPLPWLRLAFFPDSPDSA